LRSFIVHLQDWRRGASHTQWVMMLAMVLYYLSYFDEFRYIKMKPQAMIRPRKVWAPPGAVDYILVLCRELTQKTLLTQSGPRARRPVEQPPYG